jgi:hypothetical protein
MKKDSSSWNNSDVSAAVSTNITALWDVNIYPEDGRSRFLRNVVIYLPDYT